MTHWAMNSYSPPMKLLPASTRLLALSIVPVLLAGTTWGSPPSVHDITESDVADILSVSEQVGQIYIWAGAADTSPEFYVRDLIGGYYETGDIGSWKWGTQYPIVMEYDATVSDLKLTVFPPGEAPVTAVASLIDWFNTLVVSMKVDEYTIFDVDFTLVNNVIDGDSFPDDDLEVSKGGEYPAWDGFLVYFPENSSSNVNSFTWMGTLEMDTFVAISDDVSLSVHVVQSGVADPSSAREPRILDYDGTNLTAWTDGATIGGIPTTNVVERLPGLGALKTEEPFGSNWVVAPGTQVINESLSPQTHVWTVPVDGDAGVIRVRSSR